VMESLEFGGEFFGTKHSVSQKECHRRLRWGKLRASSVKYQLQNKPTHIYMSKGHTKEKRRNR